MSTIFYWKIFQFKKIKILWIHKPGMYLPDSSATMVQDLTQGQFFKQSKDDLNTEFSFFLTVYLNKTKESSRPKYYGREENQWLHAFSKGISTKWNTISFIQDLNGRIQWLKDSTTYLPNPSATDKVWHKVNSFSWVKLVWIQNFPSQRLVA